MTTIVAYSDADAVNKLDAICEKFPESTIEMRDGFSDNNDHPTNIIALDVEGVNENELLQLF